MTNGLHSKNKIKIEDVIKSRLSEFNKPPYDEDVINWVYLKGYFAGLIRADYDCLRTRYGTQKLTPVQISKLDITIQSVVNKFFDDKMSEKTMKRQLDWRKQHKDPKF